MTLDTVGVGKRAFEARAKPYRGCIFRLYHNQLNNIRAILPTKLDYICVVTCVFLCYKGDTKLMLSSHRLVSQPPSHLSHPASVPSQSAFPCRLGHTHNTHKLIQSPCDRRYIGTPRRI